MQIILADAKIMRAEVTIPPLCTTTPLFQSEATAIAEEMAKKKLGLVHDNEIIFKSGNGK